MERITKAGKEQELLNKAAMEKAREMGLVDLKGSEKQVPWANSIRLGILEKVYCRMCRELESVHELWYCPEYTKEKWCWDNLIKFYKSKKTAKFFIENRERFSDLRGIINCYQEGSKKS